MTRREFLRRTAPMIVAGALPLAGAHALWRKLFPEPKGWDGRPLRKSLTPPVYVFVWGKQGLQYDEFPNADRMQLELARSLQVPREYLFGYPGPVVLSDVRFERRPSRIIEKVRLGIPVGTEGGGA